MDHIDEYIKCYICLGKLVDATMCPHCNKLSCQKCIQVNIVSKIRSGFWKENLSVLYVE